MTEAREARYWWMDLEWALNVADLLRAVADGRLTGLVDERAGGIVAYVMTGHERELVGRLNNVTGGK